MADGAGERDQMAKQRYKELYDQRTKERTFKVGESVLVVMPDGHSKFDTMGLSP